MQRNIILRMQWQMAQLPKTNNKPRPQAGARAVPKPIGL